MQSQILNSVQLGLENPLEKSIQFVGNCFRIQGKPLLWKAFIKRKLQLLNSKIDKQKLGKLISFNFISTVRDEYNRLSLLNPVDNFYGGKLFGLYSKSGGCDVSGLVRFSQRKLRNINWIQILSLIRLDKTFYHRTAACELFSKPVFIFKMEIFQPQCFNNSLLAVWIW